MRSVAFDPMLRRQSNAFSEFVCFQTLSFQTFVRKLLKLVALYCAWEAFDSYRFDYTKLE